MGSDRSLRSVERLTGVALLLMGFMNILLSISGNYELDLFSAMIFLFGVVLFVHGTVQTWHKWIIIREPKLDEDATRKGAGTGD